MPNVADNLVDWLAVSLFAAAVGIGELISRYRDDPVSALRTLPASVYVLINVLVALAALFFIRQFGITFGLQPATGNATLRWTQVLAAAFGAMAIFRTSLFTVRAGGQDIPVGPNILLQVLLSFADREVDRLRALARIDIVERAMKGVSFQQAYEALPAYCLALMQNLTKEEQETLARQINAVRTSTIQEQIKVRTLGLLLLGVVGRGVLLAAVESLQNEIGQQTQSLLSSEHDSHQLPLRDSKPSRLKDDSTVENSARVPQASRNI